MEWGTFSALVGTLAGIGGTAFGVGLVQYVQWKTHKDREKNAFKIAALDKRLQAHQEAYTLWYRLIFAEGQDHDAARSACQEFWEENCLYLDESFRRKFLFGLATSQTYEGMKGDQRKEVSQRLIAILNLIENAANLPPLKPDDVWKA